MVNASITALKERGGSSLQAIKKYIAGNYKVDVEKLSPFIRRYLKAAVTAGTLVQTKGKGASGSFKLSGKSDNPSAAGKKVAKTKKKPAQRAAGSAKKASKKAGRPATSAKARKSPVKTSTGASKAKTSAAAKKPKAEKKAALPKSPKKPKTAKKSPTKKSASLKKSAKK